MIETHCPMLKYLTFVNFINIIQLYNNFWENSTTFRKNYGYIWSCGGASAATRPDIIVFFEGHRNNQSGFKTPRPFEPESEGKVSFLDVKNAASLRFSHPKI